MYSDKLSLVKRIGVFFIDITISYFLYIILSLLLSWFVFLPLFPWFPIVWLTYRIVALISCRKTVGMHFIGAHIEKYNDVYRNVWTHPKIRIITREILTSIPGVILLLIFFVPISPLFIFITSPNRWLIFLFLLFSIALIVALIVVRIKRRRIFLISITIAKVDTVDRLKFARKRIAMIYLAIMILALTSRVINTVSTNNPQRFKNDLAFIAPEPSAHSVREYVTYLEENKREINDYVKDLLDQYDCVVLCERAHPETTQYEMIYDLITDEKILQKANTIFTEIGNVDSNEDYIKLTSASFANEDSLDKALADFMMVNQSVHLLWYNTNWFNFLKKIYYFNNANNSTGHKINIHFTDRANWMNNSMSYDRDSLMAANIITKINSDKIRKSIVIMNYRHAFIDLTNGSNCGGYLDKEFRGRVANVLINSAAFKYLFPLTPVNYGKWDIALEQIPQQAFAFNFEGSPFGKDSFDMFPLYAYKYNHKTYADMFTGMIYYKPLYMHEVSYGMPYIFDEENKAILEQRAKDRGETFDEKAYIDNQISLNFIYFNTSLFSNLVFILFVITGIVVFMFLWFKSSSRKTVYSS